MFDDLYVIEWSPDGKVWMTGSQHYFYEAQAEKARKRWLKRAEKNGGTVRLRIVRFTRLGTCAALDAAEREGSR